MSLSQERLSPNNEHKEDTKYFSEAFLTFDEMRRSNVMTDIVLTVHDYSQSTFDNVGESLSVNEKNTENKNVTKVGMSYLTSLSFYMNITERNSALIFYVIT